MILFWLIFLLMLGWLNLYFLCFLTTKNSLLCFVDVSFDVGVVELVFFMLLTIKNSLLCFVVLFVDMVGDTCNFSRYNHVCDWYDFISIV